MHTNKKIVHPQSGEMCTDNGESVSTVKDFGAKENSETLYYIQTKILYSLSLEKCALTMEKSVTTNSTVKGYGYGAKENLLLLDVNFNNFCCNVLTRITSAYPQLNVISGGLQQLFVEPWRIVEGAACVQRPTTSTIPQKRLAM